MVRWILSLIVAATAPALACSCVPGGVSACSAMGGSTAVFVARVIVDSGEGLGERTARVVIEEALQNVPAGLTEADVLSGARTSCHYRLEAGERYVIFAGRHPGEDWFVTGQCSRNFKVRGNEHLLEALRSVAAGEHAGFVGTVREYRDGPGIPGATVVAESAANRYEVTTGADGRYEIRNAQPGQYRLRVSREGFAPNGVFNERWSGVYLRDPADGVYKPDRSGSLPLRERSCEIWDLALVPRP
jgi:hypothetical protein